MVASEIFKDKKDNYPQSVPKLFVGTRLSKVLNLLEHLGHFCSAVSHVLVRLCLCVCLFRWGGY